MGKLFVFLILFSLFTFSCSRNATLSTLKEDELFTLPYGHFEDELNMFDVTEVGQITTSLAMRDGFFYIVNGEAKKIMEFNSYGDLLALYRNDDANESDFRSEIQKTIDFPLDEPGVIAVDSHQRLYVVNTMPKERQELDSEEKLLYSQVILRFSSEGNSEGYIGQHGVQGTPFPLINNIYTSYNDDLVVVCSTMEGNIVYVFSDNGVPLYTVPIVRNDVPEMPQSNVETFPVIQSIIPDYNSRRLFVKIDYYQSRIDSESKVESGIDFAKTYVYPLSLETGLYEEPIHIPPYEETIIADYSKLIFQLPYDFIGVSKTGWMFFMISVEDGFALEMIHPANQKIIKKKLPMVHKNNLYHSMTVSEAGIISAFLVEKEKARVVWWRADSVITSARR
ncbi:MAG: hypothetical protein IKI31_04520 [Treponema sp.]|nr:hypothetical protein [Treponema sp.]